jgi:outer membrane murein-binding lipoprotein Lpp
MEEPTIVVALISLIGTIVGSISGILVSNKLTTYRIEQLEKKIDKYANNEDELRERLVVVEQSAKQAHHRIDDIADQLKITERRK